MRVLAISFLFPNSIYQNRGTFALNRLKAVQKYADVTTVNPSPWFLSCAHVERHKGFHRSPKRETKETLEGIDIFHPRYLRSFARAPDLE